MFSKLLKCDMHVHSCYSGISKHLSFFQANDSFNKPEAIYKRSKKVGMDLVTITDHDSIDGCLSFLNKNPDVNDFFISEEITTKIVEFDQIIHINVYDINEKQHIEISYLKDNATELIGYLRKENIYFNINHVFLTLPTDKKQWSSFFDYINENFDAIEAFNGTQTLRQNELFLTDNFNSKAMIGGSDAHVLNRIGETYSVAPGKDYNEFLSNLFKGNGHPAGDHGTMFKLFYDFNKVYFQYGVDCFKPKKVRQNRFKLFKRISRVIGWIVFYPVYVIGSSFVISKYYYNVRKYMENEYYNFYLNEYTHPKKELNYEKETTK